MEKEHVLSSFKNSAQIKPALFESGGITFRFFHYREDHPDVHRLLIEAGKIRAVIIPSKGLSLHEAWIEGQPIFWEPPQTSISSPEEFCPENEIFINGQKQWGTEWVSRFCSGVELLGPDNWGMMLPEERKTLHGSGSNTSAENIKTGLYKNTAFAEGQFPVRAGAADIEIRRRIILDLSDNSVMLHDIFKNTSEDETLADWGYHVQMRPVEGCQYYIPSKSITPRQDESCAPGFNTWHQAELQWEREEYGFIHKEITNTESIHGHPVIGTLLHYPDSKKSIRCDIPPAPYILTWVSAGGAYGSEFLTGDSPGTPMLTRNWDGIGPELGASSLDHDGNLNPQFPEASLKPWHSKQTLLRFKLLDESETEEMLRTVTDGTYYSL